MCYACYKSHLITIKCLKSVVDSTDSDLSTLINSIKEDTQTIIDIHTVDQALHYASNLSAIHVGEALIKQRAMLLPDVYEFFYKYQVVNLRGIATSQRIESLVSANWLRSQLSSLLQHQMAYRCSVRRYGTVLYRHNGDVVHALNVSLGQIRTQDVSPAIMTSDSENNFDENLTQICLKLNLKCHEHIQTLLSEDASSPHNTEDLT